MWIRLRDWWAVNIGWWERMYGDHDKDCYESTVHRMNGTAYIQCWVRECNTRTGEERWERSYTKVIRVD